MLVRISSAHAGGGKRLFGERMELLAGQHDACRGAEKVDTLPVDGPGVERVRALHLELLEGIPPRGGRQVHAVRADDAPVVERVLAGMPQADQAWLACERRHREARDELDRLLGEREGLLEGRAVLHELADARDVAPAAHPDADRVDRPAPEDLDEVVAGLLHLEGLLHERPVIGRHGDAAVVSQEVRRVEEEDVERVALDPLAAVEQPPERSRLRVDADPEEVLEPVGRAHLVRDGADAADPGDDVDDLVGGPPHDELLEVARRLEDAEARLEDLAILHSQPERAFALDPRELMNLVQALVHDLVRRRSAAHAFPPRGDGSAAVVPRPLRAPPSSVTMLRNGSEYAVNPAKSRPISSRGRSPAIWR